LILLVAAPGAQAQSVYGSELGAYLGFSAFYALDTSDNEVDDIADTSDFGLAFRGGFRVSPPLAIELQGDYNNAWTDFDLWTVTVNFRVYPLQMEAFGGDIGRVQPYLIAGAGVIAGDPDSDPYQLNGAFRMGAGLNVYVTDQIAIDAGSEWTVGTGFWSDASYMKFGLGLQYNF
jgi:opacity protein-like surface antigen